MVDTLLECIIEAIALVKLPVAIAKSIATTIGRIKGLNIE
jgi:hypothetical protein